MISTNNNKQATVGYDVFKHALAKVSKFVSNPLPESCVDEKISGLEHMMAALLSVVKKHKDILEKYNPETDGGGLDHDGIYEALRQAGAHKMVQAVCCETEEQPDLHIDESKPCPKMIPFRCTHDGIKKERCNCCGVEKSLGILECLTVPDSEVADEVVEVMVWSDSEQQGTKNGKQNTQRELNSEQMSVKELVKRFKKQLNICIPHYQEIFWMKLMMDLDFIRLTKEGILIFTDFAAVMVLRAFQVKNSSVDGHAHCANFVVMSNPREATVTETRKENDVEIMINDNMMIFTVDVHHFFAETMSKGKLNDHQMHIVSLDALIKKYKGIFCERGVELKYVNMWTDNCPNQYRCRQHFIQIASGEERHPGITITHRLAVVDNFKGVHDGCGKGPAHKVRELELCSSPIQSKNAKQVFINCFTHLQKTEKDTKWKEYEETHDPKLRGKGRFGVDTLTVWFVVATQDDVDRLSVEYPGRILLCDRSFTLDTYKGKAINGTTQLHEVRSTDTTIPTSHPLNGQSQHPTCLAIVRSATKIQTMINVCMHLGERLVSSRCVSTVYDLRKVLGRAYGILEGQ